MNNQLTEMNHQEWAKVIDQSALEGRLYHFNGAFAFIKTSADKNELLVVNMSENPRPTFVYFQDDYADNYFKNNNPTWASKRIVENPLTNFYADNYEN